VPRNSHTLVQGPEAAYLFGGANEEGPRRDLLRLDLDTMRFSNVKIQDSPKVKLPALEMHTAHLYNQGKNLLVLGGRGIFPGQSLEEAAFHNEIYSIDLATGDVELFGTLPADLASHQSALINDEFLVMYGGTNGLRFFDSILKYSLADKKWTLMTQQPKHCKSSRFFQDGRISASSVLCLPDLFVMFGGSSIDKECNDWLILPIAHLKDDANFAEINEIM